MQPYDPSPLTNSPSPNTTNHSPVLPGRAAIWIIATASFGIGLAMLFAASIFLRNPALLDEVTGAVFVYYLLRPLVLGIGFLGLAWKCLRYVDGITNFPIDSAEVREAHGSVWNWMAGLLIVFACIVIYHSLPVS